MGDLGRLLVIAGAAIAGIGLLLILSQKVPWLRLGRLPGDIAVERDGFSFFFPMATMILLSIVATLVFWLLGALRR